MDGISTQQDLDKFLATPLDKQKRPAMGTPPAPAAKKPLPEFKSVQDLDSFLKTPIQQYDTAPVKKFTEARQSRERTSAAETAETNKAPWYADRVLSDKGIGKAIGLASKLDEPLERGIHTAEEWVGKKIDQAADLMMKPERDQRDWLAANGYPTLAKIGAYSEAVNPINIHREAFKAAAGMVVDPKNWPFLLEGVGTVRPALKNAGTALFTVMQQYGAVQALQNRDWASAAMQEAFALLGMKDLSLEVKAKVGEAALEKHLDTLAQGKYKKPWNQLTKPEQAGLAYDMANAPKPLVPSAQVAAKAAKGAGEPTAGPKAFNLATQQARGTEAARQAVPLQMMPTPPEPLPFEPVEKQAYNPVTGGVELPQYLQPEEREAKGYYTLEEARKRLDQERNLAAQTEESRSRAEGEQRRISREKTEQAEGESAYREARAGRRLVVEDRRTMKFDEAGAERNRQEKSRLSDELNRIANENMYYDAEDMFQSLDTTKMRGKELEDWQKEALSLQTKLKDLDRLSNPEVLAPVVNIQGLAEDTKLASREGEMRDVASILEEEARKVVGDVDEFEKLQAEADEAKDRAEKLRTERDENEAKRAAETSDRAEYPLGAPIESTRGTGGAMILPDGRKVPFHYAVVPIEAVVSSHDPFNNFEPNPEAIAVSQGRDYKNNKESQAATIARGKNPEMSLLVNTSPTAETGPPIIRSDGQALGGRNRVNIWKLLYRNGFEDSAYQYMTEHAREFGVTPEQVANFYTSGKKPMVVRVLDDPYESAEALAQLGRDLDRTQTMGFSDAESAVMAGRSLTPETLDWISSQLDAMGEDSTLRDLMRFRSGEIVDKMLASGMIEATKRAEFVTSSGEMTERAKDLFESAVLGKVIDDAELLATTPKDVLRKLERSVGALVRVKASGGVWDFTPELKGALRLWKRVDSIREALNKIGGAEDSLVDRYLHPGEYKMGTELMDFGGETAREQPHPTVEALAKLLEEPGKEINLAVGDYADDSEGKQMTLGPPPSPVESFNRHIASKVKVDVPEEAWGTLKASSEFTPGREIGVFRGAIPGKPGYWFTENRDYASEYVGGKRKLEGTRIKPNKPLRLQSEKDAQVIARAIVKTSGEKVDVGQLRVGLARVDEALAEELLRQGYDWIYSDNNGGEPTGRVWIRLEAAVGAPKEKARDVPPPLESPTAKTVGAATTASDLEALAGRNPQMAPVAKELVNALGIVIKNATGMELTDWLQKNKISVQDVGEPGAEAMSQAAGGNVTWARGAGRKLTITPFGEQLDLFGGAEPQFMLRDERRGVPDANKERLVLKSELMKLRDDVPRLSELVDAEGNILQTQLFGPKEENLFGPGPDLDEAPQNTLFQEGEILPPGTASTFAERLRKRQEESLALYKGRKEIATRPDGSTVVVSKETPNDNRVDKLYRKVATNYPAGTWLKMADKARRGGLSTGEFMDRVEEFLQYERPLLPEPQRALKDVANPERDTNVLKQVQAEHPDWSLSQQLQEAAKRVNPKLLKQGPKGATEFLDDGRTIITLFRDKADASTFLHEFFHTMRRYLKPEDLAVLEKWQGVKDGIWTRTHEEEAARAWEHYHRQTEAKTLPEKVQMVFKRIQATMKKIYASLKDSPLVKPSKEVAALFDRWYGKEMAAPPSGALPRASRAEHLKGNATSLESTPDRGVMNTETPRDAFHALAASNKSLRSLNVPTQRLVMDYVVSKLHDSKIRDAVVEFVPVDVVNNLSGLESPAKVLLHDEPVLGDVSSSDLKDSVPVGMDTADRLVAAIARVIAKDIGRPESVGRFSGDGSSAVGAREEVHGSNVRQNDVSVNANVPRLEKIKPATEMESPPLSAEDRKDMEMKAQGGILPLDTGKVRVKVFPDFDKARSWAQGNQGKIKGLQIFQLKDGRAVADFTAKNEKVLFQSDPDMEKERMVAHTNVQISNILDRMKRVLPEAERLKLTADIQKLRTRRDAALNPPKEMTPPPGQILTLWTPEGERPIERPSGTVSTEKTASNAERGATDVSHGNRQPVRPREISEPPIPPRLSESEPAAGRGTGPAGRGERKGATAGEPRTALRDVKPLEIAPSKPRGEPAYATTDWTGRIDKFKLPEGAPVPTVKISEANARMLMPGQREIVESILSGLQQHDGYILATTTGSGKSFMGATVLSEMSNPNSRNLILTPSQGLIHGRDGWIRVAGNFGVEVKPLEVGEMPAEPGTYIATWAGGLTREGIDQLPWDLIVMDEVQEARKWWSSKRGDMSKTMGENAKKILYTSATPFHTALEMGHMGKLGLWGREGFAQWAMKNNLGVYFDKDGNLAGGMAPAKLEKLRSQLIERGQFISIDRQMEGYCYDSQTEILTREGWKLFADLSGEEEVATRSATGQFEWQVPTEWHAYRAKGKMIHFTGRSVDICVTPNHRMLVRCDRHRQQKETSDCYSKEQILEARQLVGQRDYVVPVTSQWTGSNRLVSIEGCDVADFAKFFGLYLAEGSASGTKGSKYKAHKVAIAQTAASKHFGEISELIARMPWKFMRRGESFVHESKRIHSIFAFLGNSSQKFIPEQFKDLPAALLADMWEWYVKGDGSTNIIGKKKKKFCSAFTLSKRLADDWQEVLQKIGYQASIRPCLTPKGKQGYIIRALLSKHRKLRGKEIAYWGKVYCVTVPNGTVYVRRNGNAAWSGNSAHFGKVPMDAKTSQGLRDIDKALSLAENYFAASHKKGMVATVRAQRTTLAKRWLEYQRLPQAIELGKKLEKEGWKVIFFSENKKEFNELFDFLKPADAATNGQISRTMPKFGSTIDALREEFGDDIAFFTGKHSAAREQVKDDFNDDAKSHLYATYAAGGVGVSLHDKAGDKPRAVVYLGPPWSGISFDQALGRPWRYGTKSNVRAYFLFSDSQAEMDLVTNKVAPRMESLRAMVSGVDFKDPVVKNLREVPENQEGALDYDHGNAHNADFDAFTRKADMSGVSSYSELPIVSAQEAMHKGMKLPGSEGAQDPSVIRLWQDSVDDEVLPGDLEAPELTMARQVNVELAERFIETGAAPGNSAGRALKPQERRVVADAVLARADAAASTDPASATQQVYTEWENAMKQIDGILALANGGGMEPPPEGIPGVPGSGAETPQSWKMSTWDAVNWYLFTNGRDVMRDVTKRAGVPWVGEKLARSVQQYHTEAGNISGPWETKYWDILKDNKITPEEHKVLSLTLANREKPAKWIDAELARLRATAPMNERIESAVKQTQDLFKEVFNRMQKDNIYLTVHDAATGRPRQIYYNEFAAGEGYFPRRYDYSQVHTVVDPKTGLEHKFTLADLTDQEPGESKREGIIRGMMDRHGLSRASVEDWLASKKRDVPLVGHIERAREADLPFFRTDPDVVISYLEGAGELLSRKKYFEQDGSKVKGMIAQIPAQKAREIVGGIMDSLLQRNPLHDESKAILRWTSNWAVSKMVFSSLKALTHSIHAAPLTNTRAYLKGVFAGLTDLKDVQRMAQLAGSIQEQTKVEMLAEYGVKKSGFGSKFLTKTGWQGIYKWGRVVSDATARIFMTDYAMGKLMKDPKNEVVRRQLRNNMQLDDSRIDAAIARRRWTEEDLAWGGKSMADKTMMTFDKTELPPGWRPRSDDPASDFGGTILRAATILKGYQFKAHAVMKDAIWDEARKGNFRPLIPFLLLYPAAGQMIWSLTALATGNLKHFKQLMDDKSWTPGRTLWHIVEDIAHIMADSEATAFFDAAVHGKEILAGKIGTEYVMGPLPSDVGKTVMLPVDITHAKTAKAKAAAVRRYVENINPAARTLFNAYDLADTPTQQSRGMTPLPVIHR